MCELASTLQVLISTLILSLASPAFRIPCQTLVSLIRKFRRYPSASLVTSHHCGRRHSIYASDRSDMAQRSQANLAQLPRLRGVVSNNHDPHHAVLGVRIVPPLDLGEHHCTTWATELSRAPIWRQQVGRRSTPTTSHPTGTDSRSSAALWIVEILEMLWPRPLMTSRFDGIRLEDLLALRPLCESHLAHNRPSPPSSFHTQYFTKETIHGICIAHHMLPSLQRCRWANETSQFLLELDSRPQLPTQDDKTIDDIACRHHSPSVPC